MERDDEVKGVGNSYTTQFRQYDPRIGRWLTLDPMIHEFPDMSPYNGFDNDPIYFNDPTGECADCPQDGGGDDKKKGGGMAVGGAAGVASATTGGDDKTYDQGFLAEAVIITSKSSENTNSGVADPLIPDAVMAPTTYISYELVKSAIVRQNYISKSAALDPTDAIGRSALKTSTREATTPIMRSIVEANRPSVESKTGSKTSANKTNAKVNSTSKWLGRLGKLGTLLTIANATYVISESEDKPAAVITEGSKVAGTLYGGTMGATLGSRFGWPGALAGGIVGSIMGNEFAEMVFGPPPTPEEAKAYQDKLIKELEEEGMIGWCFVAGTQIPMADGSLKNIEDVVIGDLVLSVNVLTLEIETDTVYEIMSPTHSDLCRLSFANSLNTNTVDHPYFIKTKGWASIRPDLTKSRYGINVTQLEEGDIGFFMVEDKLIESQLRKVEILDTTSITTYNIKVRKNKNYLANGLLVHNKCCFAEGSMVTMFNGSEKPIENISIGDEVLSYNPLSSQYYKATVDSISRRIHKELVRIEFENGYSIKSTLDHPIYVEGKGWASFDPVKTRADYNLNVKELKEGDFCLLTNGTDEITKVKVVGLSVINEITKTYNLSGLSNSNNYFVNGILVTNER